MNKKIYICEAILDSEGNEDYLVFVADNDEELIELLYREGEEPQDYDISSKDVSESGLVLRVSK